MGVIMQPLKAEFASTLVDCVPCAPAHIIRAPCRQANKRILVSQVQFSVICAFSGQKGTHKAMPAKDNTENRQKSETHYTLDTNAANVKRV